MADYKQSTVTGTAWQRSWRVNIENPVTGDKVATFHEHQAMDTGDGIITKQLGSVSVVFDPGNPAHALLYEKLNELYMQLAAARDAA